MNLEPVQPRHVEMIIHMSPEDLAAAQPKVCNHVDVRCNANEVFVTLCTRYDHLGHYEDGKVSLNAVPFAVAVMTHAQARATATQILNDLSRIEQFTKAEDKQKESNDS